VVCTGVRGCHPCAWAGSKKALSCNAFCPARATGMGSMYPTSVYTARVGVRQTNQNISEIFHRTGSRRSDVIHRGSQQQQRFLFFFAMPINHCLLLSLTWSATPLDICCQCQYDLLTRVPRASPTFAAREHR